MREAIAAERMPMIVVEGLTKAFGSTLALAGVDLTVERGTVLGLLGPNGAGKTTLVRILATLLEPDAGRAWISGVDVADGANEVRSLIGLAGQFAAVDDTLTGRENLDLVGRLYGLRRAEARVRAAEALERLDLSDAADRLVRTYSGGMRRRLDLAASLVGQPLVLIMDEPTTGLDPRTRIQLWEFIEVLVRGGTTLLLTTQYLEEADRLADRIAVIDRGAMIAADTPDALKQRIGGDVIEVRATNAADVAGLVELVAGMGSGQPTGDAHAHHVSLPVSERVHTLRTVAAAIEESGIPVEELGVRRASLDDVFLALTGHAADDPPPVRGRALEEARSS